jgi:hypothetical protein
MIPTPRYSVCVPGVLFPVEVLATSDLVEAQARAVEVDGDVYDWTAGEKVES